MAFPDDSGLVAVLHRFGIGADAVLGHGGEAWVYALDDARVVRVLHAGGRADDIERRQRLVDELARAERTFALPEVLDVGEVEGRVFAIERRLEGRSVMDALAECEGAARARLIEAHLDAAAALGDLHLEPRKGFGDLIVDGAITTSTWRGYLDARAAANLASGAPELGPIDPATVCGELPEPAAAEFVHLDAFAGNMLTDGTRITAVLDIGPTSVAGDRRLDPLGRRLSGVARHHSGRELRRRRGRHELAARRRLAPVVRSGAAVARRVLGLRRRRPARAPVLPRRLARGELSRR